MSNRSGSPYSPPRDANRVPFLTAASTADGITPVVLEADPTTHLLQVSSSGGGGGGTQYTDGSSTIAHPIGTIPVYDKAGTITAVSVANPLPVSSNNLQSSSSTATWTTATSLNTTLAQTTVGQGTVTVTSIETGTTTTAGALTFEVYDGTNWWAVQGQQTGNYTIQSSYTLVNNTNVAWTFDVAGFQQFRVRLSTAITGTGSPQVVLILQTQASTSLITPSVGVAQQLDQTNDSISAWIKGATYTKLTASGSVVSGTCVYYGYTVEASTSGTLIAYDNTAASGNTVGGTAAQPLGQGTVNFFPVPIVMTTGLYVTIGGTLTINFLTRSIGK